MSSLQHQTFGTSELVYQWLSKQEQESPEYNFSSSDHEANPSRNRLRKGKFTASRTTAQIVLTLLEDTDGADSNNSQRLRSTHLKPLPGQSQRRSHDKLKSAEAIHGGVTTDETTMTRCVESERLEKATQSHDHDAAHAHEKYARQPRHKTREDRYHYKEDQGVRVRQSQLKKRTKNKPGNVLADEFRAANVSAERLTLKAGGPGFLSKGKSSSKTDLKGLPDLTLSEMSFLKRRREEDNARIPKTNAQSSKKRSSKLRSQEISEFFTQTDGSVPNQTQNPNIASNESYLSWSASPIQIPTASQARRSSVPGYSGMRAPMRSDEIEERDEIDEIDELTALASARRHHSFSNRFLSHVASSALLNGVDTFAHKTKEYYSLEGLQTLAAQVLSPIPSGTLSGQGAIHERVENATSIRRYQPEPDVQATRGDRERCQREESGLGSDALSECRQQPFQMTRSEPLHYADDIAAPWTWNDNHEHRRDWIGVRHEQAPMPFDHLSMPSHEGKAIGDTVREALALAHLIDANVKPFEEEQFFGPQGDRVELPFRPDIECPEAIPPLSDNMDDFDKNLLRCAAAAFSVEKTSVVGDSAGIRQDRHSATRQEMHVLGLQRVTLFDEGLCLSNDLGQLPDRHRGPNIDHTSFKNLPPSHEKTLGEIAAPDGGFSGFSRGHSLY